MGGGGLFLSPKLEKPMFYGVIRMFNKSKNKGFSLVELIVVIAILVVFAAILIPSLMQYTENSRAQKDESAMDEVVNAVQLAMADQDCFDEMLQYSCTNNYVTYSDSTGDYASQVVDGEFWAPDGAGRATTITFNPEVGSNNATIYRMDSAIINDMTYGNGSVAHGRVMQGALIENNQCYLKNASLNGNQTGYTYNRVRQTIGDTVSSTSQTYRNSSFTVFIRFTQKDGVTVADVSGQFNGTNLYEGAPAAIGSGTVEYEQETGAPIVSVTTPGRQESNYTSSDLMGSVTLSGNLTEYGSSATIDTSKGVYYVGVTSDQLGNYSGATAIYKNGEFPSTVNVGDVYVLGDYEYRYGYVYYSHISYGKKWVTSAEFSNLIYQNGGKEWCSYKIPVFNTWSVRVLNANKSSYGEIVNSINNAPVENLSYTFSGLDRLSTSPQIPAGIKVMVSTYYDSPIRNAPDISHCNSLITLRNAFGGTHIVSCENLIIPNSVVDMNTTFVSCGLEIAPVIPENVLYMTNTFANCPNLSGTVTINANPSVMNNTFYDTKKNITLVGASTKLSAIAATDGYTDLSENDNVRVANKTNVIPVGGIYYVGGINSTEIYSAGQPFPSELTVGDVYVYGDYRYLYKDEWCDSCGDRCEYYVSECGCPFMSYDDDGWSVEVLDMTKSSYGQILDNINGKPVVSLRYTFSGCKQLTVAPTIPNTVKYLGSTFSSCEKLTKAPKIPEGTVYFSWTFSYCTALNDVSALGYCPNITSMEGTFYKCTSLEDASPITIPKGVYCPRYCFAYTGNIKKMPIIEEGVGNLQEMFYFSKIEDASSLIIPESVWCVNAMFYFSELEKAPVIPSGVWNMKETFYYCKKLTGEVIVHGRANYKDYAKWCFGSTELPIKIVGNCSEETKYWLAYSGPGNVTY